MPARTRRIAAPPAVAVIGAGVGGLTAACELQRRGSAVTLVERRHVGGCATTFPLGGVAYDAGATLAFGLDHPGLLGGVLADLGIELPCRRPEIAWSVRGEGFAVDRWVDRGRWLDAAVAAFGPAVEPLWQECEAVTDTVLAAAARRPALPPTRLADWLRLAATAAPHRAAVLAPLVARPFSSLLERHGLAAGPFRRFCDLQLLITAQAPADRAMALYGALALVLPHRGTAVLEHGMGSLATALAARFAELGGTLLAGEEAVRAQRHAVTLASGRTLACDAVILNTTPWDAQRIVGRLPARHARRLAAQPEAWGALCLYLALPASELPAGGRFLQLETPAGSILGDRQSVFVSIGGAERDTAGGLRPATVSVHAHRGSWPERGPRYDARKAASTAAVLELLAPHLPPPARTITATPATWVDFAGRAGGRVGGFPAVAGLPPPLPFPPRLAPGVWLAGDSVVPGQSTMAVALAGRTVALAAAAGR